MKMKKLVMLVAAFMLIAANAFAAGPVVVTVTSEPIMEDSTCDKAGGFTYEFQEGSTIEAGDQLTIDTTLRTTLCKSIDLFIEDDGDANTGVVTYTGVNATQAESLRFHITGVAGTQRVTIDVLQGSLVVPNDGDPNTKNVFTLRFLTQDVHPEITVDPDYNFITNTFSADQDDATLAQNTLCIDVSDPRFVDSVVRGSLDSKGDLFTYTPSDPQIAHIADAAIYSRYVCKGDDDDFIAIGEQDSCTFDWESNSGYCDGDGGKFILKSDPKFNPASYEVTIEVLVNGQSGTNGVYFATSGLSYGFEADDTDAVCSSSNNGKSVAPESVWVGASKLDDDDEAAAFSTKCGSAAEKSVTKIKYVGIDTGSTATYMYLNFPTFRYDTAKIDEGDVVTVKVTIGKAPCSVLWTGTVSVGTFGCDDSASAMGGLYYPYFTAMQAADLFWDGIAVTNYGSKAGAVELTIYEEDGDVGTYTIANLPAYGMSVSLLSDILPLATKVSGPGTLGNARCWIKAKAADGMSVDGFAMIADPTTGQSMGYLPRSYFAK